ncbi:MAG: heme-binding domain-containing protein [Flavobacteriaceae bacterium]
MKYLKKLGWLLVISFIIAQFFQPEKNDGDISSIVNFVAETNPPSEVHTILKNACFDCHSNKTKYPWYSKITPVNYWMADHVKHGKGDLNFSHWKNFSLKKKEHKMEELWKEVSEKEMPLNSYTWTHFDAQLSDAQIKQVVKWAKNIQSKYKKQLTN